MTTPKTYKFCDPYCDYAAYFDTFAEAYLARDQYIKKADPSWWETTYRETLIAKWNPETEEYEFL